MKTVYDKNGNAKELLELKDIEHGSNTYGEYWKFSNGLLICRGKFVKTFNTVTPCTGGYYDDGYAVIFPHNYIDENYHCEVVIENKDYLFLIYSVGEKLQSNCKFNIFSFASRPNVQTEVSYFSIGRWK